MSVQIIAHRTCPRYAAENSIAGLRKAAEAGADGVEADVRRALDGAPILMHDWSPWRTARLPGPVRMYPSLLLRRLRQRGSDERIPTLAQALDALPEGLFLVIDVKAEEAAAGVLRLVHDRGLEERTQIWSGREGVLGYFLHEAPGVKTVLLREDLDPEGLNRYLDDAERLSAHGMSPHWSAVTPQLVGEAHDRGLSVYSMNRDMETVAKKLATGIDGIVTDSPREVRAILEEGRSRQLARD